MSKVQSPLRLAAVSFDCKQPLIENLLGKERQDIAFFVKTPTSIVLGIGQAVAYFNDKKEMIKGRIKQTLGRIVEGQVGEVEMEKWGHVGELSPLVFSKAIRLVKLCMVFPFRHKPKQDKPWDGIPQSLVLLPKLTLIWENGRCTLIFIGKDEKELDNASRMGRELFVSISTPSIDRSITFRKNLPQKDSWTQMVTQAIQEIQSGHLHKVVLARCKEYGHTYPPWKLAAFCLSQLEHIYEESTLYFVHDNQSVCFGASPEILLEKTGEVLKTMALAGTVQKSKSSATNQKLKQLLISSQKMAIEHRAVTEAISQALRPFVKKMTLSDTPQIMELKNIQHLYTPIEAVLKEEVDSYSPLLALHPTPAVGGVPKDAATDFISNNEPFDRGWYTGFIGLADFFGNYRFSVILRCALATQDSLWTFAGAGIVEGSNSEEEWKEAEMKMRAILQFLEEGSA